MHTRTPDYIYSADAVVVPLHTVVCLHLLVPDASMSESVYGRTSHKVNLAQLGRTNRKCVFLTVGAGTGPDQ